MIARHAASLIAAARALNSAFFFVTSVYCLLTYSPFTYEQFIKPNVSAALSAFALWHGSIHWLVLCITALTLAPFLERPRARWLGWSYLAASVLLGAWFFTHPLWQQPGTSPANLVLALVSTLPPVWLAVFDHAATPARTGDGASPAVSGSDAIADTNREWAACWTTALFVCVVFAAAAPIRLRQTGGIVLPAEGLVLGAVVSVIRHLTMFTLVYLTLTLMTGVARFARSPRRSLYWLIWSVSAAGIAFVLVSVMLAPIAVRGAAAWAVSAATGVAVASAWSGIGRYRVAIESPGWSALDAWLAPIAASRSRLASGAGLVVAAVSAHVLIARLAVYDWEFMLQKLVTLGLWVVAFGFIHHIVRARPPRVPAWVKAACVIALFGGVEILLPRAPALAAGLRLNPEIAVDAYAAVDPSFRVARDMLGPAASEDAAEFYAYLRAHSTIQKPHIEPVDIDFVPAWNTSVEPPPPHIFLFIIDSLRPDYLSPYNEAVPFTPQISAFASESFVFRRAFSRYAGTGLSVPAIWAGSMLVHKQYVTPFAPMNALEKLVAAKGYRRFITADHLTEDLFEPSQDTVYLDRGVPEMLHTFCRTLGELRQQLEGRAREQREPIFAMTRPLELHIGNIASAEAPPGESYPGFHAPYAARVRRIDACFGEFVGMLRQTGLYENSIIVLTSDHGDSLGEGQRWGHGFTAFPEVLRIPLIIHVPEATRRRVSADLARVSFSTDITPTLYALLGERPRTHGRRGVRDLLVGAPLLVDPSVDLSGRRRESYLVASSYGPVYGLISRNGRRLYLADGVESREYGFDLGPDRTDARVGMTDLDRETGRDAIRQHIGELADWYGYAPQP